MALPVNIILYPPKIVVSQTASIYGIGFSSLSGNFSFGYVEQPYSNYASVYAGQRVLYSQNPNAPFITMSNKQYSVIDENDIYLVEPIEEPT